ncbi:Putative ribonuclease H protein At1g65750 [Linum perenne]
MNLGKCSFMRAELRGAIKGLEMAWEAGYKSMELQLDSRSAISILEVAEEPLHHHVMEVLKFRDLRIRNWTMLMRHVYREENKAANYLVSRCHEILFGCHVFLFSDCNLGHIRMYDCMGFSEPRSILINP